MTKNPLGSYFWIFLLMAVILQLGVIRKNENQITKTQTDPISLKQKEEETKDGVKGAPGPSFTYYGKQDFLVKSSTETYKEQEKLLTAKPAETTEVEFEEENLEDEDSAELQDVQSAGEEDWWEEDSSLDEEAGAGDDLEADNKEDEGLL